MDWIAWVWYIAETNLFHIFKSCHVWLFKTLFDNQSCMQEWVFLVEVAMAEETEGEVTGTEAQEGQGSPYILMLTTRAWPIVSGQIFQLDWERSGPT
jgi:hypothetical protein